METFVSEKETKSIISSTFVTISLVILGMIIAGLLYWSYVQTDRLYITIFSGIVFAYVLMMIIFIALIRAKLTEDEFKIYMSVSIFMGILTLLLFSIFLYRTFDFYRNRYPPGMYPQGQQAQPGYQQQAYYPQQPSLAARYNQVPLPYYQQQQPMSALV